jgi:hypothetical protein
MVGFDPTYRKACALEGLTGDGLVVGPDMSATYPITELFEWHHHDEGSAGNERLVDLGEQSRVIRHVFQHMG